MKYVRTEQLREMLIAGGEESLAALPEFEVPDEQYDRNFAEVCAQGLHESEDDRHARALYRCLTSRVTGPLRGGSAVSPGGFHQELKREFAEVKADMDALRESIYATQRLIERRHKQLVRGLAVIWIGIVLLFLFLYVPKAHGQDKPVASAKPVANLVVPDSYKLRIRDVQYAKDKVLIRLQNLQLQEQRVTEEANAKDKTINEIVYQLAVEEHIDLSKWVMDLDTLRWQPKEK